MTRALLYARYSTAMQSESSVEDQFRLLRQRVEQEGWAIAGEFADRAISGTVRDRPGLINCMRALETGEGTVLLAESLDRISRDQEDLAGLFKRVRFQRARIITLSEGEIGSMHIGLGGTLSAMFLEQLAEKTRRGQIGRVEAGRIPGGLSYGYRAIRAFAANGEVERGLREVDEGEAAVVRRIFELYADGESPLAIAKILNAEGISSPRGGLWRANTINGHRQRRNGILHNELYRGRILYNRQSFRKDPETRKRVSHANSEKDIVSQDVPALRIVDEQLWNKVQARLAEHSGPPVTRRRRPRRLLSGLLKCGECGGTFTAIVGDRWGCATKAQTGTCANGVTITNSVAEARVWSAIQHHLLHPDVIAAYIDERRLAAVEERREQMAGRARRQRRLAELDRENDRFVEAIARGVPVDSFVKRMQEIVEERSRIEREAAEPDDMADAIIHPAVVENYRRQVEDLHALAAATNHDEQLRKRARDLLEQLVERIDVNRKSNGKRGAELLMHGNLAALLALKQEKAPGGKPGALHCTSIVVAGVGFEPTTFRL